MYKIFQWQVDATFVYHCFSAPPLQPKIQVNPTCFEYNLKYINALLIPFQSKYNLQDLTNIHHLRYTRSLPDTEELQIL